MNIYESSTVSVWRYCSNMIAGGERVSGCLGMQSEYLCDTEVNLCYSNPCRGNGTCVQREGGYICLCPPAVTGTLQRASCILLLHRPSASRP